MQSAPEKIGPYIIDREIGRGGMGVVLLAHDPRLDRRVAIKSLAQDLAHDEVRLARFEREARLLASLSHQNIASVYGFEEHDGIRYLVMEFVEGETLASRLNSGPLPLDEALSICTQIAGAVEAAHDAGVIHRDLKPGNVIITPAGVAKVLDFGLAKIGAEASSSSSITMMPTATAPATVEGHVLGTPGYMSPEQARGRAVDRRTDIFSFGCILYECLCGQRAFPGETTTDAIAAILERDPGSEKLPRNTPIRVRNLLERCLEKDPRRRLRDIGDARIDLEIACTKREWSSSIISEQLARSGSRRRWNQTLTGAALLLGAALIFALSWFTARSFAPASISNDARIITFDIVPRNEFETPLQAGMMPVLSPDGRMIVYPQFFEAGRAVLHKHNLETGKSDRMPGTTSVWNVFFSPDSRWIAYFTRDRLIKVPVDGGPEYTIAETPGWNGQWLPSGVIVFEFDGAIYRMPETGGTPEEIINFTVPKPIPGTDMELIGTNRVTAVPNGKGVLLTGWTGPTFEDYVICYVNLDGTGFQLVQAKASSPHFVGEDTLVFSRESTVYFAPFDLKRMSITAEPHIVLRDVMCTEWADPAFYSVSSSGSLVFIPGGRRGTGRRIAALSSTGEVQSLTEADCFMGGMRVSPDGKRITVQTLRRGLELWTYDLARGVMTPISVGGEPYSPTWADDGKSIVFTDFRNGRYQLVKAAADGGGTPTVISVPGIKPEEDFGASDWREDGSLLLQVDANPFDRFYVFKPDGDGTLLSVINQGAGSQSGQFSKDGNWIAHTGRITEDFCVYLSRADGTGQPIRASLQQGWGARWSHDGTKLFYTNNKTIFSMDVDLSGPQPVISESVKVVDIPGSVTVDQWLGFDILPDGRFLVTETAPWEREQFHMRVVINWAGTLKSQ